MHKRINIHHAFTLIYKLKKYTLLLFYILLSVLGISPLESYAQKEDSTSATIHYKFSHFSSKDGLPQNSVLGIYQDDKGFLWVGTDDGLARFDGFQFKTYRHNRPDSTSLSSNVIRAITAGINNYLWIGTEGGGISVFDPQTELFHKYLGEKNNGTKITSKKISSLLLDNSGNIWIGTQGNGLYKLISPKSEFSSITEYLDHIKVVPFNSENSNLQDDKIWNIYQGASGKVYVGTLDGGAYYFDEQTLKFIPLQIAAASENITSVKSFLEDSSGRLWVGTEKNGLWVKEQGSMAFTLVNLPASPSSFGQLNINITTLREVGNKQLWVGTLGSGLYILNKDNQVINHFEDDPSDPYSINGNSVYTSFEDRRGNIWLGMYSGEGLNKVSPNQQQFEHFRYDPRENVGLSSKMVKTILKDKNENLWIGLFNGGINILPKGSSSFQYFTAKPYGELSYIHVQTIVQGKDETVWIGTDGGGINKVTIPSTKVEYIENEPGNPESLSKNEVWAIAIDTAGMVWVGMANGGGLNRIDPKTNKVKRFNSDPQDPYSPNFSDIRSLLFDSKGQLWIGTYGGGLNKMDPTTGIFEYYTYDENDTNSISHNIITSLMEDENGKIWIGTFGGGLNTLDQKTGKIEILTVKDGLPSDIIKAIVQDNTGQLWISTVKGLSSFDEETNTFKNYTEEDGLQSNEFNLGSVFKDSQGKLYFGGTNGFNAFYPDRITPKPTPNAPVFTQLKVLNKEIQPSVALNGEMILKNSITYADHLELKYSQNNFEIDFSSLEYFAQEQINFQYKLEGFNKEWITTTPTRRFATYSNLPHGSYVLHVRSFYENSEEFSPVTSLKISIIAPWYLTIWAWIAYFILFTILVYAIKRFVDWRIKLKNDLRFERIEKQKQEEVNQLKLNFFTNISHELRTPLMLINAPLEKLSIRQDLPDTVQKQLSSIKLNSNRLLRLINQLLDFRKQETGNMELQVSEIKIRPYFQEVCKSFEALAAEKKINFALNIADSTPENFWIDEEQFQKVMFNLIYNAFKFTPEGGTIKVLVADTMFIPPNELEVKPGIQISVEDNGLGIPQENLKNLFERFYQIKREGQIYEAGTGIGLALTKSLVDYHGGNLDVSSVENELTSFRVFLQQGNSHFKPEQIIAKETTGQVFKFDTSLLELETTFISNNADQVDTNIPRKEASDQKILVVEDNPELLDLIKSNLEKSFTVISASNGKEALELIAIEKPNLVISDIMMPEMDGITLCSKIKQDINTSHLMVILLTAKSSHIHQLEGYESGADDYLVKPFQLDLLELKVKNLLFTREKLQAQFSQTPNLAPSKASYTSTDQKFLELAMQTVEKNMDNTDFSVNDFVKELGMSRTLIFEKFKALAGLTPNDYIQTIRLKRAAQLIIDSDLKISEISYSVGFSNPKYFSKCFVKQFGKTPSVYKKEVK